MTRKFYNKKYSSISNPDFHKNNEKKTDLKRVADDLVDGAIFGSSLTSWPNERRIENAIKKGEEIPEFCKPGRVIMKQSKETREKIKKLKSHHFNDRLFGK